MEKPLSSDILNSIPEQIFKVVNLIVAAGGKAVLGGGSVVDLLLDRTPKDWDIEVYGVSYDTLVTALTDYDPKTVGKSFGIIKLSREKCDGADLDISVPRRDNRVGVGHKDFECDLDPTMTPKEAAMRRDFTINSMYIDLKTGTLVDYFGGLHDLQRGVLRATNPETFVEDPLRALRAMQLLARKAKVVDPSTMALIRTMRGTFPNLSKERVYEEFRKLLMFADKPSIGLNFLRESLWLENFPELQVLIGCDQHPDWHPEGDVWTHTLEVTDSAAFARDNIDPEWAEAFIFGAMLHDVGKPETTVFPEMVKTGDFPKERLWTAWEHDTKGRVPAENFLRRLTNDKKLIERAVDIVGLHMQPYNLFQGEAKANAYKRLHNKCRLDILGWMSKCDCCGRPDRHIYKGWPYGDPNLDHDTSARCFDYFAEFGDKPIEKILQGRHLVKAGLKPGPIFKIGLDAAYEAQLEGLTDEDELLKVAVRACR